MEGWIGTAEWSQKRLISGWIVACLSYTEGVECEFLHASNDCAGWPQVAL